LLASDVGRLRVEFGSRLVGEALRLVERTRANALSISRERLASGTQFGGLLPEGESGLSFSSSLL
jgi:hypothetical protein